MQEEAGRNMCFPEVLSFLVLNFLDRIQFERSSGEKNHAEMDLVWILLKLEWDMRWNAMWTGIVGSVSVISDSN